MSKPVGSNPFTHPFKDTTGGAFRVPAPRWEFPPVGAPQIYVPPPSDSTTTLGFSLIPPGIGISHETNEGGCNASVSTSGVNVGVWKKV